MDKKPTAVVMSGGGAKGCYQVGMLKALQDYGYLTDVKDYYGSSVGSLNSAGMAFRGIEGLEKIWSDIKSRNDILKPIWWKLLWAPGAYTTKPLEKILEDVVQGKPQKRAVSCYVDYVSRQAKYCDNQGDLDEYIDMTVASSSIPVLMDPVKEVLFDGGVTDQTPLTRAIEEGHRDIIVLLTNPVERKPDDWEPSFPRMVSYLNRTFSVMLEEMFKNDLKLCQKNNHVPGKEKVNLWIMEPKEAIIKTIEFDPEKIREGIDHGYEVARGQINERQ